MLFQARHLYKTTSQCGASSKSPDPYPRAKGYGRVLSAEGKSYSSANAFAKKFLGLRIRQGADFSVSLGNMRWRSGSGSRWQHAQHLEHTQHTQHTLLSMFMLIILSNCSYSAYSASILSMLIISILSMRILSILACSYSAAYSACSYSA